MLGLPVVFLGLPVLNFQCLIVRFVVLTGPATDDILELHVWFVGLHGARQEVSPVLGWAKLTGGQSCSCSCSRQVVAPTLDLLTGAHWWWAVSVWVVLLVLELSCAQ